MRIAIFSDIHEDIDSLREVFRKIRKNNVDKIVCLGDISGFSAPHFKYLRTRNAHECLNLISQNCDTAVIGNHDIHAAKIVPQNCSFFNFPDNWYELDYHDRKKLAGHTLWLHEEDDLDPLYKEADKKTIQSLIDYSVLKIPGNSILFSHYVYPNLSGLKKEFYTYADEFKQHFQFMETLDCTISFTGHAHTKGFFMVTNSKFKQYKYIKRKIPKDPVCIGVPPVTSNGARSGYCIYDTEEKTIEAIRVKRANLL